MLLAMIYAALLARQQVAPQVVIRASAGIVTEAELPARALFLVLNNGPTPAHREIRFRCPDADVSPASIQIDIPAGESRIVSTSVHLHANVDTSTLDISADGPGFKIVVRRGIDLTQSTWRRKFTPAAARIDSKLAAYTLDDRSWAVIHPPLMWQENDNAWCRVHFTVPAEWRGRQIRLMIAAVDDNDVTFLNGFEIGKTNGWDVPRNYIMPEGLITWGGENVLTVMVENPTFGGGLYKAPIYIAVGNGPIIAAPTSASVPVKRTAPGSIGEPLPLRKLSVKNGVLRYPDGAEVSLWGVNMYPQSWVQFENMKRLHVDIRKAMRTDLDHLQQMGVEVIRIHVFDREISDGAGNLIRNEHLDILDDLAAECTRRGIYLYLTPIAWWGGPNERPDSFSAQTSKPGMMFVQGSIKAEANYLQNFLNHTNPYTGRPLKTEPCLRLIEVMNEPAYFAYEDLSASAYEPQGENPDVLKRDHAELKRQWQSWLAQNALQDSPVYFPLFRYQLMRSYIRLMIAAIKSTGDDQPIAISNFGQNGDDIVQAIGDSDCDAVTISAYPGGWEKVNDGLNLISAVTPQQLPAALANKARLAYEFDTPAANVSAYLYPVIAAMFRNAEVQIACQFQYDSMSTAAWNLDWNAHWLNWLYSPSKALSWRVAEETFHNSPRGMPYVPKGDEMLFGGTSASFKQNISLYADTNLVIHSRSVPERLRAGLPPAPGRIIGAGNSPYVSYGGTGIYTLTRSGDAFELTVNPDQRLIGNSLRGSLEAPVAELESNAQLFLLKLPGWEHAICKDMDGKQVLRTPYGWALMPGIYRIQRH